MRIRRRTVLGGGLVSLVDWNSAEAADPPVTGLVTAGRLEDSLPCFVVTFVRWDSPFRAAGLQIGDRITAVDGRAVAAPAETRARQIYVQGFPGQLDEAASWAASGRRPGDAVRLSVRRRAAGHGWQRLELSAALYVPPPDRTAGRPALFPGGPDWLADDGMGDTWSSWWEKRLQPLIRDTLVDGWDQPSWNSRVAWQQLSEQKPRVDLLRSRYPGPYSVALGSDFDAALASAAGTRVTLTEAELRWRRAEDDKRAAAATAAQAGWDGWLAAHEADRIEPFPAADPLGTARGKVAGKIVVLPELTPQDWIEGADRTYFVAGNQTDGWYAADASQPAALAMLLALERWRRLVSTTISERYVIAGRILPKPTLVVVGDRSWPMLQLELVAAKVGDAMFVDLAQRDGTLAPFAGEAALALPHTPPPPDDAPPETVLAASAAALKTGDLAAWKALFADFSYDIMPNGAVMVTPWQDPRAEDRWEDSRRLMLDRVFDVAVAWVDDPALVTDGTAFPDQARIETVAAMVNHVGRFDGADGKEFRVFTGVAVRRHRQLVRMNGGPWRIASGPEV